MRSVKKIFGLFRGEYLRRVCACTSPGFYNKQKLWLNRKPTHEEHATFPLQGTKHRKRSKPKKTGKVKENGI